MRSISSKTFWQTYLGFGIFIGLAALYQTFVRVAGEEDYAFVPAVIYAPLRSAVAYGQPGRGVVVCKVDENEKRRLAEFVKRLR